jgi:hypothetical protein
VVVAPLVAQWWPECLAGAAYGSPNRLVSDDLRSDHSNMVVTSAILHGPPAASAEWSPLIGSPVALWFRSSSRAAPHRGEIAWAESV